MNKIRTFFKSLFKRMGSKPDLKVINKPYKIVEFDKCK